MMVAAPYLALAILAPAATYPADASLRAEDYVRAGLPAPDRTWGASDYVAAATLLEKVGAEDSGRLPRHGSRASGAVFARMTHPDNLGVLSVRAIPVAMRMQQGLELTMAANRMLLVYLAPMAKGVVFDRELAECMGFLLQVAVRFAEVVEEFLPTIPPDDPQREQRTAGLVQFRSGASQLLAGGLTSVTETQTYRPEARRALARHIAAHAPRLLRHLTEPQQSEAVGRLERLAAQETDAAVRDSLAAAAAAAQAARPK